MEKIWFGQPTVATLNTWMKNTLAETLKIRVTELGSNFITAEMPVSPLTHQPYGILHGGASVALAETLGSIGAALCFDPDKFIAVGLQINANHLKMVRKGWVSGTAHPIHTGKRTHLWEINIFLKGSETKICTSRITMAILPKSGT